MAVLSFPLYMPKYDFLLELLGAATSRAADWWGDALAEQGSVQKLRYHATTRNLTIGRKRAVLDRISGDELLERAFARGVLPSMFDVERYEWGLGLLHARCVWASYYQCSECGGKGIYAGTRARPGLHEALHVAALTARAEVEALVEEVCQGLRAYGGPAFRRIRWVVAPPGVPASNTVWTGPPSYDSNGEPLWTLFGRGGLANYHTGLIAARLDAVNEITKRGVTLCRIEPEGGVELTLPSVWEVAL